MKNIEIIDTYYECGDGCCQDQYYTIEVDDVVVCTRFQEWEFPDAIRTLLKYLNIDAEVFVLKNGYDRYEDYKGELL